MKTLMSAPEQFFGIELKNTTDRQQCSKFAKKYDITLPYCMYTFNNELSGEVDHVGRVAGQAGVGPTVGRPQAVEQDVAAEGHVLNSIQLLTIL